MVEQGDGGPGAVGVLGGCVAGPTGGKGSVALGAPIPPVVIWEGNHLTPGGVAMLRLLVRTPRRRLAWLILTIALAWAAWAVWPPAPEARWSLPADEGAYCQFTPDGRTVVTYRRVYEQMPTVRAVFRAGPLVGRDPETGRERYRALEAVKRLGGVELTP